jgi:uncharacterized protein YrzB (UPF0473 family)
MDQEKKNDMNQEKNNEMDGMEEDVIIFEDEDGAEYSFVVEDYLFYNGEEYALLSDADAGDEGDVECVICKVVTEETDGEETETFELVEDDDLAAKLLEIFNTKMREDEAE